MMVAAVAAVAAVEVVAGGSKAFGSPKLGLKNAQVPRIAPSPVTNSGCASRAPEGSETQGGGSRGAVLSRNQAAAILHLYKRLRQENRSW